MQKNLSNETTSRVEVVLALHSGEKLILDLSAFADLFAEAEMKSPEQFYKRFQELMDRYVETVNPDPQTFDVNMFKNDYEFLRKFRELFKSLTWKEVVDES